MDDLLNYVLYIICEDGEEIKVSVNDKYHKHIQAFRKADNENLNIEDYIKRKGTDNITGYELASFLGASRKVVFFHTDVSNYKINNRKASIIIPKDMTNVQKDKLKKLCINLKKYGFTYYLTQTQFKKNSSYKLIHKTLNLALLEKLVYNVDNKEEDKCKM